VNGDPDPGFWGDWGDWERRAMVFCSLTTSAEIMEKSVGLVVGLMRGVADEAEDPMELLTRAWMQYVAESGSSAAGDG
jgi:hypothetical protein